MVIGCGRAGEVVIGPIGVAESAAKTTTIAAGVPNCLFSYCWGHQRARDDGGLAAAQRARAERLRVWLRITPVILSQIDYRQAQYPEGMAPQVEKLVKDAYEEVDTAKRRTCMHLPGQCFPKAHDEMLKNPCADHGTAGFHQ